MGSKKVRIVITCESRQKALEEAKKWVLQLEKEVLEERRNCRTRGLILLGTVLLGAISDEDTKFRIYERFIEIDTLLKSKNTPVESKKAAKEKAGRAVIDLARALSEKLKKEAAAAGQAASQGGTVTKQS
ncbi:hypothetical protein [Aminivibrio sp.]|jgi:hypothetical protein|uniref:hypothetical protein n=1 Tax=Aminivibrio sp. TaxID=1872489 RepID=UPI001A455568|nr:hypothetical protein [Aminivibrio sp.]MBL3538337.1 hypothetical protein [Aminivibrio sp.]